MRLAISVLASVLAMAPLDARSTPDGSSIPRIRPVQREGARLLAEGLARSPTFRRLVERLERSRVIVYIELRPDMPIHRGGALRFLARSRTDSFLKIHLNRVFTGKTLIALLGHELQHAVEVADAGGVASVGELRALYQRLGERTGPDQFDTIAARKVGYVVRHELSLRGAAEPRFAMTDDEALPESDEFGDDASASDEPALGIVPVAGPAGATDRLSELVRQ
jgi:hypothetical protein